MVNENSSIFSLLLLLSLILSANVCIIVYLDLYCVVSTHLHGIRADGLLNKSYTKIVLQVQKIEDNEKMDYSLEIILTPPNYLEWKPKILLILICRGLYQITMEMEVENDFVDEKNDFLNRQDMSIGCILYFISPEILHQLYDDSQEYTLNDLWRRLEVLFGNK
jgi:hypothetical protein